MQPASRSGWWELDLRTATISIGCISLISAFINASSNLWVVYSEGFWFAEDVTIFETTVRVTCVILSIPLIIGSITRRELFLLPYIIFRSVGIPGETIFMVVRARMNDTHFDTLSLSQKFAFVLHVVSLFIFENAMESYLLFIIICYYRKLKAEKLEIEERHNQFSAQSFPILYGETTAGV